MLKFIEKLLSEFHYCFSRVKTYNWFLVIIFAFLTRYDSLGVTYFIRALSLEHHLYETMLHFFRSYAYKTSELKQCWHKFASDTYFALDRYFLTASLLRELCELNTSSTYCLDIITREKLNCTAYYKPESNPTPHRGRPRRKGNAVRLSDLFESRSNDFIRTTVSCMEKNRRLNICP